jgi:hypothetical protein
MNYELNELIGNTDVVRFMKSRRIAWLGHVMRMDGKRTPKRILQWKPIGTRTRGRPRKRWIEGTEEDLQIMGVRRWRKQCEERAEWKKITEKAKPTVGCNASKRRRRFPFKCQLYDLTRRDKGKGHPITGHEDPEVE